MKFTVERIGAPFHFRATTETGHLVDMDSGPAAVAAGPMQLLVIALGGCSGIDLVDILTKGRQEIDGLTIELEGERTQVESHKPWSRIHVHYGLTGDLDEAKVRRAVGLSLEKYCSVAKTLEHTAVITSSFSINGVRYDD